MAPRRRKHGGCYLCTSSMYVHSIFFLWPVWFSAHSVAGVKCRSQVFLTPPSRHVRKLRSMGLLHIRHIRKNHPVQQRIHATPPPPSLLPTSDDVVFLVALFHLFATATPHPHCASPPPGAELTRHPLPLLLLLLSLRWATLAAAFGGRSCPAVLLQQHKINNHKIIKNNAGHRNQDSLTARHRATRARTKGAARCSPSERSPRSPPRRPWRASGSTTAACSRTPRGTATGTSGPSWRPAGTASSSPTASRFLPSKDRSEGVVGAAPSLRMFSLAGPDWLPC